MDVQPTIIFDLDGTLADTLDDLVAALNRSIAEYGVSPVDPQKVAHLTGRGGLRAMITFAFETERVLLSQKLLNKVFVASVVDYNQNIAVKTKLYPGAKECLERFAHQGWLLGVCTNKPLRLAQLLLRELAIEHRFSAVTGVDSFDFKKPDPRHLTRTITMAGGEASKAIMVGDTQNDILTAQNAKIPIIAVDFGYSEHPLESYSPDRIVSNFETLFDVAKGVHGC